MDTIVKARINDDIKKKAMFILKCNGSDLSKEIRKMCEKLAEEYDKENKGE